MSTFTAKPKEIERKWLLIDAEGLVLGRLASEIAMLIKGKHKRIFTPNIDTGDHVIVINAEKVVLTGAKYEDKQYFKHTGFAGGVKETSPRRVLEGKFPERVIELAVKRMLTRNNLGRAMMRKLKIYAGANHPHAAQNPVVHNFAAKNRKNKKVA